MRKAAVINPVMLVLSLLGGVAAFIFGEVLLAYLAYLPYWLQCGIYLLFVSAVCCIVMLVSEAIRSGGYILRRRQEFKQTATKAALIFLPSALALGILTQLLFGLLGLGQSYTPHFQGTIIVCDISGSMLENDPDRDAVEAIVNYIDAVPLGEYLGVTIFNHMPYTVRPYTVLNTEEERAELKDLVLANTVYDGGTDIQAALLDSFDQIREGAGGEWPGLVLLFSDGQSPVEYAELQRESVGDINDPKTRIPVNTIYYASSPLGGYQMSEIAQRTGGTYFYMGVDSDELALRDVFAHSRSIFTVEKPHLLKAYYGFARNAPLRVIMQALFLALWGVLSGALVVVFLNNNRLIKDYLYAKIGVSVAVAGIFTAIITVSETDVGRLVRALLTVFMCLMYVPTYTWDTGEREEQHSVYVAG